MAVGIANSDGKCTDPFCDGRHRIFFLIPVTKRLDGLGILNQLNLPFDWIGILAVPEVPVYTSKLAAGGLWQILRLGTQLKLGPHGALSTCSRLHGA